MTTEKKLVEHAVLDAAEKLFSEKGFHAVSVREIVREAGAHLASVNYHFGSKDGLLLHVLNRRMDEIAEDRLSELNLARCAPKHKRLDAIVSALITPMISKAIDGGDGWRRYMTLLAQVAQSREMMDRGIANKFNETAVVFIDAVQQELPALDRNDVIAGFLFTVGSMLHVLADTGRVESLRSENSEQDSIQTLGNRLLPFIVGGLRAMERCKIDEEQRSNLRGEDNL